MKTTKGKKRGIIAVSTLYISIILLILIVALLVSLKAESGHVLRYNYTTEALYIGEAGLADCTMQLSSNNFWPSFPAAPIVYTFPDGRGKYTIKFTDTSPVAADESVNNLNGNSAVDGPRGPGTVPAKTADVVVTVEHKGRILHYEGLISRGFSVPLTVPMLTSGKIEMHGNVVVAGVESATDHTSVPAGIHSNNNSNAPDIITWYDDGGEAYFSGSVSTSSANAGAISTPGAPPGAFNALSVDTNRAQMAFPLIDVETAVRFGSLSSPITVVTGGTTTVGAGDHSYPGGTINGDLVLNGANLFVDGNLEVNGTIKGSGAIYVTGDTSFKGTSEIVMDNGKSLALFSKGNVKLQGFDGTQFLEGLATANPTTFGVWYQDSKDAHEALATAVSGAYGTTWGSGSPAQTEVNEWRNVVGGSAPPPPPPAVANTPERTSAPGTYYTQDSMGEMINFLNTNYPTSESAQFVVKRLQKTRALYVDSGELDTANAGTGNPADAEQAVNYQDFDRLGSSYFQGVIYTNGALYASNEVEILGALLAKKLPGMAVGSWNPLAPASGPSLGRGDVYLGGDTHITYNKELLENPFVGSPTGPVVVVSWMGSDE